jgi:voltage-gated potassium channel Kch
VLCLVAVLAGGSDGRVVVPLWLDPLSLAAPTDARALRTTDDAVRGIAAIMANSFGLAVPDRVVVHVYDGRRAFEQGLIRDARVSPVLAAKLSDVAIGVGARGQVLLNDRPPDRTEREWLRLIAHELTHVSQIELAGGEGRGEQWLAEGMAEWVAFSTLERLGVDTVERRRQAATAGIRRHATLLQTGLDLEAHGTPQGFTAWHLREGSTPVYQLAFLITDSLIEGRGFDRTKAYFASFRRSGDRRGNFESAFGVSLADFEAEVLARLKTASAL